MSRLGLAWSAEVGAGGGAQESTPLVSNGVDVYSVTNWSIVFAVDARTGKEKWRWDPEVNRTTVTVKICCRHRESGGWGFMTARFSFP